MSHKATIQTEHFVDSNHFSVSTAINRLHLSKKEYIDGLDDLTHSSIYKGQLQLIFNHTGKYQEKVQVAYLKFDTEQSLNHFSQIIQDYLLERNFDVYKQNLNFANKEDIRIEDCVLYVPNQQAMELNTVSRVSVVGDLISFRTPTGTTKYTESIDNIEKIKSITDNYFKKVKTLAIFKDLKRNNPMLSPKEAWASAEETYSLLDGEGVANVY